jgi:pimeloyl-ACP methyl ester carboxylesterase
MRRHLALLLFLLLTGCQALENQLVFHPWPARESAAPLPEPLEDVTLHTRDGVKIQARWCPHPRSDGVILYCHGNAGNLEQRGKLMRDFWLNLERSVLIFDYPGYGRSEGNPSEAGCYASAEAAYDWLQREKGYPPERIIIAGESLGGGVAVDLASKHPAQQLVLIRTFTSVPDVAKQSLSSAPSIMVNRFDSLMKIPSVRVPVFIAQADRDRVMPFAHAEQLRDACMSPVRLHRLEGLGHNDPLPPAFFDELRTFIERAH